MLFLIN